MPETTVYTNNKYYQDIADAIREKNGTENTYTPAQMAPAIRRLAGGEEYEDGDLLAYGSSSNNLASSGEVDSMILGS